MLRIEVVVDQFIVAYNGSVTDDGLVGIGEDIVTPFA
jgi:hypothetical protein